MKKRGRRINHRAKAPPGVVVQFVAADYEIRLRSSVNAFRLNYAEAQHFNDLADCVDLIRVAEATEFARPDDGAMAVCELAGVALNNIRDRHRDRGRFGATGDEIRALEQLAEVSLDYWNRRSGALYRHAYNELNRVREAQEQESAA